MVAFAGVVDFAVTFIVAFHFTVNVDSFTVNEDGAVVQWHSNPGNEPLRNSAEPTIPPPSRWPRGVAAGAGSGV